MSKPKKDPKAIKANLLEPAFDLIKKFIISRGHGEPKIIPEEQAIKVIFNDKRPRECTYSWEARDNGRVYQHWDRPPDHGTDTEGTDASELTPKTILDNFESTFRIVL